MYYLSLRHQLYLMKKDIEIVEVKDVYIAAIRDEEADMQWSVYLLNDKDILIEGVMITSRGYDVSPEGAMIPKTTQFRHAVGHVPAKSMAKVEVISPDVFELFNEFWVTFFEAGALMEKRFTFGPHTIDAEFEEDLPGGKHKGIIVK